MQNKQAETMEGVRGLPLEENLATRPSDWLKMQQIFAMTFYDLTTTTSMQFSSMKEKEEISKRRKSQDSRRGTGWPKLFLAERPTENGIFIWMPYLISFS